MKKIGFALLVLLFSLNNTKAQTTINRDPEIAQMIKAVSKDSVQLYIQQMVAFGTRNTLSTGTDSKRGIGEPEIGC